MKSTVLTLAILFVFPFCGEAQNLTGTWVGAGGGTDYIKLVIRHREDSLVGYTHDIIDGFCYASFSGAYSPVRKRVTGRGGILLEHSPNHVLTDYDWNFVRRPDGDYLVANSDAGDAIIEGILNIFGKEPSRHERQWLKRISKKPELLKVSKDTVVKQKSPPPPPAPPKQPPVKPAPAPPKAKPVAPKPTTAPKPAPKPPVKQELPTQKPAPAPKPVEVQSLPVPEYIVREKLTRESKLMRTIYTSTDSIKLFIYDNGEVDGDTVTVFFDDKVVLDRARISEKARVLTLPVSRTGVHSIDLFANNLGSIPPNTALLVIHAGKERYELHASYDFKTNARILVRFKEE